MKYLFSKPLFIVLGAALILPAALLAQVGEKDKEKKEKAKEKSETQQIIITRSGDKNEKITVEVNGDKVTVNGKPIDEYKGDNVIVRRNRNRDGWTLGEGQNSWSFNGDNFPLLLDMGDSNRAMLGVTTEKADKGVEIQTINKESAASKAGLKEGDVITKIDEQKIEDPDDLSKAIKAHKPGDKVNVTYLRDDKEQKVSAELSKWKGSGVLSPSYKMDLGDVMSKAHTMPRINTAPFRSFSWSGGGPKLGLSVQDTDDGKGVKVIEVDDESNAAKAGIKEDDIITEVEGKAVNSADEVAKIIKDSKDKTSVMVKLTRAGKTQNIEVKIPRKLKTADL
ncbi:MAG: PDZ domain-containing protein [Bacteroidota bacterium]|nr:PDZ domain-containing protein [Bacteroidota bacterium]